MSIGRWMDKKIVVHILNGILLSYKKEHIWVSSNEVDEPGAYYTEWSESERKDKSCISMPKYGIQTVWWSYMRGSKGAAGELQYLEAQQAKCNKARHACITIYISTQNETFRYKSNNMCIRPTWKRLKNWWKTPKKNKLGGAIFHVPG